MSGKTKAPVKGLIQIYSLINMKKTLPFVLQLTSSVLVVQYPENALPLGFLKKSGVSGEEFFLRMEKFLGSFQSTEARISGPKPGRV